MNYKYKVLFVCAANVGRSQMAEGFYNHFTNSNQAVSAAGIQDCREKYEYRPDRDIVKVMQEEGIDISNNLIKLVNEEIVSVSERIIIFCDPSLCPEYLKRNTRMMHVAIEDPYQLGLDKSHERKLEAYRSIRDKIRAFVLTLV